MRNGVRPVTFTGKGLAQKVHEITGATGWTQGELSYLPNIRSTKYLSYAMPSLAKGRSHNTQFMVVVV